MKEMYFSFGALSDKFSEQCERQGYKLNNADKWDDLVHCTIMLYIHNILTDSRYNECLSRILKKYKKDLVEIRRDEDITEEEFENNKLFQYPNR